MECPFGWPDCPYWMAGDDCSASDQSEDYCPCFDPEEEWASLHGF